MEEVYTRQYYVHGNHNCPIPVHLNFGAYILDRLKQKGDEIAVENVDTKEKLSYKEFTQYAVDLSALLTKLGVRRGDIVGIGSEKRNEFIPTCLGILFTGATYTPYEIKIGKISLKHKLSITKPKYLICSKIFWNEHKEILKTVDSVKLILTVDDAFDGIESVKDLIEKVDVSKFEAEMVTGQNDVAIILYSSGTTGLPKGVELTHLNCIINSNPVDFQDEGLQVAYVCGEWYHNYDTFMTFKLLLNGRKIVYADDYDTTAVMRCISDLQANIIFVVPSHVTLLSKEDLDKYDVNSLKIIYSRSSPLHKKTIEKVKQRFPNLKNVLQGYGMTEAGELTSESWGHKGPKPGSVGKASPGITLKISDVHTRKTVGPNERGEICLKGPVLMKGYVGMDLSNYTDEEGFFKTGDLGYYDEDQYFYIVGRLKEIIINNGFNVSPLELETLLQMHPDVREAGVVGKIVPIYGELPTAFVVKQPGSKLTEEELKEFINSQVSPYMQLDGGVFFVEALPKNPRGKILRGELKKTLNEDGFTE